MIASLASSSYSVVFGQMKTAARLCYDSFHPLEAQAQYNQRFVLIHFYISLAENNQKPVDLCFAPRRPNLYVFVQPIEYNVTVIVYTCTFFKPWNISVINY